MEIEILYRLWYTKLFRDPISTDSLYEDPEEARRMGENNLKSDPENSGWRVLLTPVMVLRDTKGQRFVVGNLTPVAGKVWVKDKENPSESPS